jgi:hypothetical protein
MRHGRVYDYVGKDRSEAELARYLDGAWEDAPAAPVPPPYSALYVLCMPRPPSSPRPTRLCVCCACSGRAVRVPFPRRA